MSSSASVGICDTAITVHSRGNKTQFDEILSWTRSKQLAMAMDSCHAELKPQLTFAIVVITYPVSAHGQPTQNMAATLRPLSRAMTGHAVLTCHAPIRALIGGSRYLSSKVLGIKNQTRLYSGYLLQEVLLLKVNNVWGFVLDKRWL